MASFSSTERIRMRGVPGEEQKMLVLFGTTDFPLGSRPISVPGRFRVQFLLARPGRLKFSEREPSFLTNVVGDSHLGIGKPASQRTSDEDIVGMVLQTRGDSWQIEFKCVINDDGYIGKIVVENLPAQDYRHAESVAYQALTPFLSSWSLTLDVPVLIETIQVTDLTTHTDMLRLNAPYVEMTPGAGHTAALSQDFRHYASVYREGMNTNSSFYRFLCFYKIAESIYVRRGDNAKQAKTRGEQPRKYSEDVPLSREAIKGLLGLLYPWRTDWDDDLTMDQILPAEARGKRFKAIRGQYLEPLRDRVAHALMRSGKIETVADRLEDVNAVTKWLPLLRIWVRLLLKIEFPGEFGTSS
ncbi:hypothetical protein H7849_04745 [Alloacidobacterium dinghuense]|uniref:Uncharacterized protein n=1 Tax=Alloacidobacterium dinghuense TaxID=2763107 RepID=A0A7G8BL56_9BACT|nr:methylamine utilization protein MauJ [Alloacidobacterium dinghuense]QNI33276.1 hypothetical protein H7849_04745 [Alloacidobacterium dinghuense]